MVPVTVSWNTLITAARELVDTIDPEQLTRYDAWLLRQVAERIDTLIEQRDLAQYTKEIPRGDEEHGDLHSLQ